MPVPDTFYEATFLFKNDVSPRIATTALGFATTDITPPDASEAANAIHNIVRATGNVFAPGNMIDDWHYLGCHVALGTPTGDLLGELNSDIAGTLVDNAITSNCACLVTKSTALGGRRYRGRMFLPPFRLNEGAVDAAGNIAGATVTAINTSLFNTLTALATGTWFPVLFHQGAGAPDPTPITALTCQSLIATQRRRMRG